MDCPARQPSLAVARLSESWLVGLGAQRNWLSLGAAHPATPRSLESRQRATTYANGGLGVGR